MNKELREKAKSSYVPPPSQAGRKVFQKLNEDLPVDLTDSELNETGASLAQQWTELSNHESHEKQVKSELKARKDAIMSQIKLLALRRNTKQALRSVEVVAEANFDHGVVEFIRQDTKQVVRTRPIQEQERQEKIPFEGVDGDENDPFLLPPGKQTIDHDVDE